MAKLATFWSGPLTPLEIACMLSFAERGHTFTLYSFEKYDLPGNIAQASAHEILDASWLNRFKTNGATNLAHFADLFRLRLFQVGEQTWVDCDVVCLEPAGGVWADSTILRDERGSIMNCVLRISDGPLLAETIRLTENLGDSELPWAATQNIISKAMRKTHYRGEVLPARRFSPIDADHWFKLLLPEYRDECAELCAQSHTLHLYNNILQKVGYLKSAMPPDDSYLREVLESNALSHMFSGSYSAQTVRSLAENWQLRFSGGSVGFGALVRQLAPSLVRTITRRRHR